MYYLPSFASPTLRGLETDAGSLAGVIGRASQLAESVSCKVRLLDQAKVWRCAGVGSSALVCNNICLQGRVYACMKRVDDVIDLKV